ncbi:39S ribosomal protein L51, mitochondrial [Marasmius crinis-equi]|uniref:Large ribosomal subunit protein mL43 n=1 Tax=Marasmius crinis-equi TaxID=585013 RepID=A0ABR3G0Q4_9AGAR
MRIAPVKPLLRAKLGSSPSNGHTTFIPQIRKLVFEYCDKWPSSHNLRTYLLNHVESVARTQPHVEVVVRQRPQKEPIIRGFYLNNRDKVIGLKGLEVTGIQQKVQLLLDSSGAKIKPLKKTVESSAEAARGIWSGLHAERPSL